MLGVIGLVALFITRQIEVAHHLTTQASLDSMKLVHISSSTARGTLDSIWSEQKDSLIREMQKLENQKPKIVEKIVYVKSDIKDEVPDSTYAKVDSLVTYLEAKVSVTEKQLAATQSLLKVAKAEIKDLRAENEALKAFNADLTKRVERLSKQKSTAFGGTTKFLAGAAVGVLAYGVLTK